MVVICHELRYIINFLEENEKERRETMYYVK